MEGEREEDFSLWSHSSDLKIEGVREGGGGLKREEGGRERELLVFNVQPTGTVISRRQGERG